MSQLHKIAHCDDQSRVGDVVFVHGLDGGARETWHPKKKPEAFWPAWVGEDFSTVGVWSLDYEASALAWRGNGMPLLDRAANCMELFTVHDLGKKPLVLVTHSLGGLLAKQMLRHANDTARDWLADSTRGIVFLATPHTGSSVANWIDGLGKYLLRPNDIVKNLKANDDALVRLNQWYVDHAGEFGIQSKVFYEDSKTKGVVQVVGRASGALLLPRVDPVPVDADHISICKPDSKGELVYLSVNQFITSCLRDGRTESSTDVVPVELVGASSPGDSDPKTQDKIAPPSPLNADAPMSDSEVRKMLTSLAPANFDLLIANIPGAANQVPSNGVVAQRALVLIQWAEAYGGPGLAKIGSTAKDVLPNL